MEKKRRENAVYISSLPDDVTEDKIGELFGSIGVIKVSFHILIQYMNYYCC